MKACQQYALDAYADNIVLLDTGSAKLMTPYYPLEELRMIPGFDGPASKTHCPAAKATLCVLYFAHVDASLKADGKNQPFSAAANVPGAMGRPYGSYRQRLAGRA